MIICAVLCRFNVASGITRVSGAKLWTTVTHRPSPALRAEGAVAVAVQTWVSGSALNVVTVGSHPGDRARTNVWTSAVEAGLEPWAPRTAAHRAPSCARSETMLYCHTMSPNSIVPRNVIRKRNDDSANSTSVCPRSLRRPPPGVALRLRRNTPVRDRASIGYVSATRNVAVRDRVIVFGMPGIRANVVNVFVVVTVTVSTRCRPDGDVGFGHALEHQGLVGGS
jgi:hypothetical protein